MLSFCVKTTLFCGILLVVAVAAPSCVTNLNNDSTVTGSTKVIATLDLFTQVTPPKGGRSWLGDWELRRERLDLVDLALRDIRPDIVLFQNSMRRTGSSSESDALILRAGSLARYHWRDIKIENLVESGEERMFALAVARPIEIPAEENTAQRNYWQLGTDGHLAIERIEDNGGSILLANVLMPLRKDQVNLWYSFLQERILDFRKAYGICSKRVVVAGYLPFEGGSRKSQEMMDALGLKDTVTGFCQNAERCYTANLANGIYALTSGDDVSGQVDKILVHQSAQVISGSLAFNGSRDTDRYKENYQLNKLWASQRFGWISKVRLAKCESAD